MTIAEGQINVITINNVTSLALIIIIYDDVMRLFTSRQITNVKHLEHMKNEIKIHLAIEFPFIVGFRGHFEVYIYIYNNNNNIISCNQIYNKIYNKIYPSWICHRSN